MQQLHTNDEILSVLQSVDCAAVSTASGANIRSRMMHYWNDKAFAVYLATMKGDPKTLQITENPTVSLLIVKREEDLNDSREVEITGRGAFVKDKDEKERAYEALASKSPVVKYLKETNNLALLDCIKVKPVQVKYRVFKEIVQGSPPTVLEFRENQATVSEFQQLRRKLGHWKLELRPSFLTATIVSILLGTAIAWVRDGAFRAEFFVLAMLGGVFLHLGTNVLNDYADYRSGNDEVNREFIRPFSGGSRTIQLGFLTPLEVLSGALLLFFMGTSIGVYLAWTRGWMLLVLGLVGLVSGLFYTMPPINWASRGLGEMVVGVNFGVLMTLGAYYVQTLTFAVEPFLASLPVCFLITAVLYINEFPDYNADKAVGKRTLVVRLGRERAAYGYVALVASTYGVILLGIALRLMPVSSLIALATLPLALKAMTYALAHSSSPTDLVPANALTVMVHLFTSLLLSVGYLMEWLGFSGLVYVVSFLGVSLLLSVYFDVHMEKQRKAVLGLKKVI